MKALMWGVVNLVKKVRINCSLFTIKIGRGVVFANIVQW